MNTKAIICIITVLLLHYNAYCQNRAANNDSIIYWSCAKLKWADFKKKPNKSPLSIPDNEYGALSSIGMSTDLYANDITGSIELKINPFFKKNKSWFKDSTALLATELLKHEQLHFDIGELFARRIKARFVQIRQHGNKDITTDSILNVLNAEVNLLLKEKSAMNILYDKETNHGLIVKQQKKWDDHIAIELSRLNIYKSSNKVCQ